MEKDFTFKHVEEVRTETTYIDAGYGDDDMIGDVQYIVRYSICPLCNAKREEDKMRIKILSEKPRR